MGAEVLVALQFFCPEPLAQVQVQGPSQVTEEGVPVEQKFEVGAVDKVDQFTDQQTQVVVAGEAQSVIEQLSQEQETVQELSVEQPTQVQVVQFESVIVQLGQVQVGAQVAVVVQFTQTQVVQFESVVQKIIFQVGLELPTESTLIFSCLISVQVFQSIVIAKVD